MIRKVVMFLVCMFCSDALWAAEGASQSGPIYNPATKSYFQLFDDNLLPGNWEAARKRAATKSYNGVRGRLAVVDSMETHNFILRNFGLNWREASVWIGLRDPGVQCACCNGRRASVLAVRERSFQDVAQRLVTDRLQCL